jgi:putative ABC transport system ATP-binding protein
LSISLLAAEVHELRMDFRAGSGVITVLDISRLEIAAGTCTGLSGPSGSGKTTLLNILTGILTPSAGRVAVGGVDLSGLTQAHKDRFRAEHIGYVFQSFNLIPPLTALDNVLLSMSFASRIPAQQQRSRARELLERVGLGRRLHHHPSQLSHGEQQRVGIARALANRPELIVADEPTASLEPGLTLEIGHLLAELCREEQATLVIASHDPELLRLMEKVEDMHTLNRACSVAAS